MTTTTSREWLDRLIAGDPTAGGAIFARYADRLLALARSRLSPKLSRRIDADDVLQSAFHSFFAHAREGAFQLEADGDLWRLLAAITLNKLARQARRHRAGKRSLQREEALPLGIGGAKEPWNGASSPSADLAAAEELSWLLSQLTPTAQAAVEARLAGANLDEIAAKLGRSERSVRRWLADARNLLDARWAATQGSERGPAPAASREQTEVETSLHYGDYRLEQLIGAGGVCKVYRATEKASGRQVAVKTLRKRFVNHPRMVQRFLQEVAIVAKLRHPHIVPILGHGRLPAGGHFLVMELVIGKDLAQIVRLRSIEPHRAAEIVATIAEAIEHSHAKGVIHRDLTPANILLADDGKAFVTDFGFAWLHDADHSSAESQRHEIVGAPGFIAPEQFDQRLGPIGPRTDVYGLGAVLLFLLGEAAAAEFREIGERCMSRDPAERPGTAIDVARKLRNLSQH